MKLYTSRYFNPGLKESPLAKVGFTQGMPRFALGYELVANLTILGPPAEIRKMEDRAAFAERYYAHLEQLGVKHITDLLRAVYCAAGHRDLVLLCFENIRNDGEWCHRAMFSLWWEQHTGERVDELDEPEKAAKPKGGAAKKAQGKLL